jgi:ribosomal protein S18 acetylase RimI-like enzyme
VRTLGAQNYAKAGGTYSNYATDAQREDTLAECRCRAKQACACGEGPPTAAEPGDRRTGEAEGCCQPQESGRTVKGAPASEGPAGGGADAMAAAASAIVSTHSAADSVWIAMCASMEKKCFAKHEAMDISQEVKGRGVTLLCAALVDAPAACVGFAVLQRSSIALALTKLVVAPHMRRQGIGRALLAQAIATARQARAQVCTLHVDETNEPAVALYRSMGFAVSGRRVDYYRVGRSALAMELPVVPP